MLLHPLPERKTRRYCVAAPARRRRRRRSQSSRARLGCWSVSVGVTIQAISALHQSEDVMTTTASASETVLTSVTGPVMSVTWPAAAAAASHLSSSGAPSQSPGRQRPAAPVVLPPLAFDVRLIPEYDGSTDVVEWFSRTEMLCRLRGVPVESVLPLRLSGGAFAVWSQLPAHSQSSLVAVRGALYAAFALDQHAAYEAFSARRLRPGESADVFLADLRRLAALFGGLPERALTCAFVAGLPDDVRQTIRAGSKAEGLDLTTIVVRARAILSNERVSAAAVQQRAVAPSPDQRPASPRSRPRRPPRHMRCWACGELGHIAARCQQRPGNGTGEDGSAPPSSPAQH